MVWWNFFCAHEIILTVVQRGARDRSKRLRVPCSTLRIQIYTWGANAPRFGVVLFFYFLFFYFLFLFLVFYFLFLFFIFGCESGGGVAFIFLFFIFLVSGGWLRYGLGCVL